MIKTLVLTVIVLIIKIITGTYSSNTYIISGNKIVIINAVRVIIKQ